MISGHCNSSDDGKVGLSHIPPGTPWNNGFIESFDNRLRKECPQPQPLTTCSKPASASPTSSTSTNRPPPLSPGLPAPLPSTCAMQPHPLPRGLRDQLKSVSTTWPLKPGGPIIGDRSPGSGRPHTAHPTDGSSGEEVIGSGSDPADAVRPRSSTGAAANCSAAAAFSAASSASSCAEPMLDRPRTALGRPHDLHRSRPRGGLHGPHVGHRGSLRPRISERKFRPQK